MTLRRTDLERVDDEVRAALARLAAVRTASRAFPEQDAPALQELRRARREAQQAVALALDAKAAWLCQQDEAMRQRFAELDDEIRRLQRLVAELDRELAMQRAHDPPPLQPLHVQLVRARRRQAKARARSIERERMALLLDGIAPTADRS